MMALTRRMFLGTTGAALAVRTMPFTARKGRFILELVRDKATGTLRAVDRFIPG